MDSFFVIGFLCVGLTTAALLSQISLLSSRVLPPALPRIPGLDGLRGVLATSVIAHHCVVLRTLAQTGQRQEPPGNLANLAGQFPVAIFFMVSAYLFLGKILRQGGKLELGRFAWGRLTRLAPTYLLAIAIVLSLAMLLTGFHLEASGLDTIRSNLGWLGVGFLKRSDFNGVPHTAALISPVWSLRYEWILYALLPICALLLRVGCPAVGIVGAFLLAGFIDPWYAYFGLGGLALQLTNKYEFRNYRSSWIIIPCALVILAAVFHGATAPGAMALAFVIFATCISNPAATRVLDSRPLQYAGQISYSVYLTHLPILGWITFAGVGLSRLSAWSDLEFFGYMACAVAVTICFSSLAFVLVEKPGMNLAAKSAARGSQRLEAAESLAAP